MALDRVPEARVVRESGRPARPIPVPFSRRAQAVVLPMQRHAREALGAVLGMWPLTAVILMIGLLLVLAGNAAGP
jgi:hypothetical protein